MHTPLRVIQVGLGGFGRSWATVLRGEPKVELVAVVDPAPPAREWAGAELGLSHDRVLASLDDALVTIEADAVVVVTPPETHHATVIASLRAGRHVLVEKPLATSIADARDLVTAADLADRFLMVSQNYRFRAPARAVRAAIAGGTLGELVAIRMTFGRDTRQLWPPDNFRYAMRHPLVLDMAIHHADLLRMVTGRNVVRVDARSWRAPDSPYVHDPEVLALMELEGGVPVVYDGSWATRRPETSWNAEWEFIGTSGRLLWTGGVSNALTGEIFLERWGAPLLSLPLPELPAVDRAGALSAFIAAINGEDPLETSARDNIHSLSIVLAWVRSIEEGVPISLAEFH